MDDLAVGAANFQIIDRAFTFDDVSVNTAITPDAKLALAATIDVVDLKHAKVFGFAGRATPTKKLDDALVQKPLTSFGRFVFQTVVKNRK